MDADLDISRLPIPDWGLLCPRCRYDLRGLTVHRCPECGGHLDMERLVRPWTRVRAARFRGDELPAPDFGLRCGRCGADLAAAPRHACPACSTPFDPAGLRPRQAWFVLGRAAFGDLQFPIVEHVLAAETVPHYVLDSRTVGELVMGGQVFGRAILVPSEFCFDAWYFLRQTQREIESERAAGVGRDWRCPRCGEAVPGHFDICWNCEGPRTGDAA